MKKVSLKDMKRENRRLVLQEILEHDNLSRIELAQQSELSPSTVSSLVSELLEEAVLIETGELASTGGRKRTGLTINPDYASIAVVDVKRSGAMLRMFDMQLQEKGKRILSDSYISGNELLIAITAAIFEMEPKSSLSAGKLAGIGLLFQEDMMESEFNVMYSTSLSSASISLKDALFTQFHVPVLEEYSQRFTMVQPVVTEEMAGSENSAFIHIGQRVLASVTIDGRQVNLQGRKVIDITPLVETEKAKWLMLSGEEKPEVQKQGILQKGLMDGYSAAGERMALAVRQLTNAIKPLCVLFSPDTVFLGGKISKMPGFIKAIQNSLNKQLEPLPTPKIEAAVESREDVADVLAGKIRKNALCAN